MFEAFFRHDWANMAHTRVVQDEDILQMPEEFNRMVSDLQRSASMPFSATKKPVTATTKLSKGDRLLLKGNPVHWAVSRGHATVLLCIIGLVSEMETAMSGDVEVTGRDSKERMAQTLWTRKNLAFWLYQRNGASNPHRFRPCLRLLSFSCSAFVHVWCSVGAHSA